MSVNITNNQIVSNQTKPCNGISVILCNICDGWKKKACNYESDVIFVYDLLNKYIVLNNKYVSVIFETYPDFCTCTN